MSSKSEILKVRDLTVDFPIFGGILNKEVSKNLNPILRNIVSAEIGTAGFANVKGYEIGGKTGTAQKSITGSYSK